MKFANWTPVSFERVTGINGFWKDRMDAVRETTVRVCLDYCKSTGRIANFRKAAGWEQGAHQGIYFDDSDVYKVLEGVAYLLTDGRCPALEQEADEIIDAICAAQWDDGYINTYYTLTDRKKRWTDMARHEAYCIGHMVEGAIAYAQATGKTKWLDTAIRAVKHMMDVFGPGKKGSNLGGGKAGDAAADFGDQECEFGVASGEIDELVHVGFDGIGAAVHGGDGV